MSKMEHSPERQAQLARLEVLPDDQIDTADIPEAPAESWDVARRGLHRPIKKPVTLRLDADVVSWFKAHAHASGYQTEINRVLRQHVVQAESHGVPARQG